MEQQARLAMFVMVLTVFFALLHIAQGAKTTCEAPTVRAGSPANITCFFSEDVRLYKKNVKVLKTKFYSDTSESVVECFWSDSHTFQCDNKEGYLLQDHQVTNRAVVVIPKVTSRFEGTYMCEAVPSNPTDVQVCELRIDEKADKQMEPSELRKLFEDQRNMNAAIIVITAVTLIAMFVVAVLFFNRRRLRKCPQQWKKGRAKNAEEGMPLQPTNTTEQQSTYPDEIGVTIQRAVLTALIKIANIEMSENLVANLKNISQNLRGVSSDAISGALLVELQTKDKSTPEPLLGTSSSVEGNEGKKNKSN